MRVWWKSWQSGGSDCDLIANNFENSKQDLERQTSLFQRSLISESEYNKFLLDHDLIKESVSNAENTVALIREGESKKAGHSSNLVKATLDGMVLDVPVKEGTFVIETNTFNEGTTIVNIANMSDMIFEGTVDEAEVGKIRVGMPLELNIGALDTAVYSAVLEYIDGA